MDAGQFEMVTINDLVGVNHPYRRLKALLDFDEISKSAKVDESELGANGYGKKRLTMCMVLQFMEDQSDWESERFLGESIAGKWKHFPAFWEHPTKLISSIIPKKVRA